MTAIWAYNFHSPPPSASCCVANLNTHTLLANLIEECKVLKQIYQHYLCVCARPPLSLHPLSLVFLLRHTSAIFCIHYLHSQATRTGRPNERTNEPTTNDTNELWKIEHRRSSLNPAPLILSTSLPTLFLPPLFHLEARALHHKQPQTSANPKRILLSLW